MSQRDFYQLLGVGRTASSAEIRQAYARLVRLHHPDRAGALPERLRDVQEAYRCLSNPAARAAHDRRMESAERAHHRRQAGVRRRLRHYDRRHPQVSARPAPRFRAALLLVTATILAATAMLALLA